MSTRLGIRRHCQSCSVKYYDLNKTKIICPSCNTVFDPEVRLKSRRIKVAPTPVVAKPATGDDSIADPDMIAPDFDGDGDSEDSSGLLRAACSGRRKERRHRWRDRTAYHRG